MRSGTGIGLMMVWLMGASAPALAQQDRTVGLVMGYPASVGVLWHVSDRVALRPDVALTRSSTETVNTISSGFLGGTETITTTMEGWTTAVGLSGLFYLGAPDPLRFYVTPRVAWTWTRSDTESSQELGQLFPVESESDGWLAAGSFGAQYAPHDRFRLFGELGLSYTRQEGTTGFSLTRNSTTVTGFGLRSGVGVVVYF